MTQVLNLIAILAILVTSAAVGMAQDAGPPQVPPPAKPVIGQPPAPALVETDETRDGEPTRASDTRPAVVRATPEATLDELRADPDFQYDKPVSEQPSLWDRFWRWVFQHLIAPFFERSATPGGRTIWFIIAAIVLIAVVLRLFRADLGGIFGRSDRSAADEMEPLLDVENIADADLRTLLARALESGAFREVVRFRYLIVLQTLAERGAIEWSRDKTNRQYVSEVRGGGNSDLGQLFADATRVFDYVWYGGLPVDAARYASLIERFERLDEVMSVSGRRGQRVRT